MASNWPVAIPEPDRVIVLDLVGGTKPSPRVPASGGSNEYFDLPREGYSMSSAPSLVNLIWSIGAALEHDAFVASSQGSIIDDHLPFINQGLPGVDLIDFYPPIWHTTDDIPAYCDAAALEQVGETMEALLRGYLQ
jgi:hypothetical protein